MAFQLKSSKFIPHCFVWRGGLGWGSPGDGRDEEGGAWQGGLVGGFVPWEGEKMEMGSFGGDLLGGWSKYWTVDGNSIHTYGRRSNPSYSIMGDPFYANWFATPSYSPRVSATSHLTISWKQNLNIQNERPHCKEIETLWLNYKYTIRFFQPSWVGIRIPCRATRWRHRRERLVETTTRQVDNIFFLDCFIFFFWQYS